MLIGYSYGLLKRCWQSHFCTCKAGGAFDLRGGSGSSLVTPAARWRERNPIVLVLTRRSNEKLSFPQVGITVHFIRVQAGHVKVGVDAPRDIAIVRDEIADGRAAEEFVRRQSLRLPREVRLGIGNQLQEIREGALLYRELITAGLMSEAEETFITLQQALERLADNEVLQHPDHDRLPSVPGAVVLIDDEANERELLSGFLRLRGHHVVSFSKAREAIQYLAKNDRSLFVLVNVGMSDGGGPATIREIRANERQRDMKIFAIGCTSPQEYDLEIGECGVDRCFPKPLNPRFLIEALEAEGSGAEGSGAEGSGAEDQHAPSRGRSPLSAR